jgi:hypothetical protein
VARSGMILGVVLALAMTAGGAHHAGADPIEPQDVRVIDGDTIRTAVFADYHLGAVVSAARGARDRRGTLTRHGLVSS